MIRTRLLSVLLHTTRDGSVRRLRTELASHAVIRQRQLLIVDSVACTVNNGNFCCFVTSAACSAAGKKPKLEASSADEDSPVKRPGRKSTVFDSSPSPSPQKKTNGGTSPKRRRIVSSSEEDAPEAGKASPSPVKKSPNESKTVKKEADSKKSPKSSSKSKKTTTVKEEKKTPKSAKSKNAGSAEKKTTVKKEQPEVKREPSESPKKEGVDTKDKAANVMSFFTSAKKEAVAASSAAAKNDGTEYNPGRKGYHPLEDAFWRKGEKVPYLALARTFQIIEETSGRLRMIEILANYFRSVILLSPCKLW
uniref:DNA ligase 1 n=1 Tax=Culex pipiens TaxID=7175 RepID=A0A8D8B8A3_CULPI